MGIKEADIRPQALFNQYLELARRDVETFFSDHSRFVSVDCPACDSGRHADAFEKLGFTYRLCDVCGTLFMSPRPGPEQLDAYYVASEAVQFWSTHFYAETAEARRERLFRPRAELAAGLVDDRTARGGVLADIGSGYGIFLEEASKTGRFGEVVGIEPAPPLAEVCRRRGFRVVEKPVEDVAAGECRATLATSFEVLEHVFSPLEFLSAARRILEPGGVLLFTTLTVSGFDIQVLWEHSKSVYPPHHINLMSVEGMRCLVERAAFRIVDVSTPGVLDVDIVANIARERPGIALPRWVSQLLLQGDGVKADFQQFLSRNLLSSHIRVVAST